MDFLAVGKRGPKGFEKSKSTLVSKQKPSIEEDGERKLHLEHQPHFTIFDFVNAKIQYFYLEQGPVVKLMV